MKRFNAPAEASLSELEVAVLAPYARPSLRRALRSANYRLYLAGQVVSLLGTWIQKMAQGWLVYRLTNSPALLGLTTFCGAIPIFFTAPFGGMVADRFDRRKLLLSTQSAAMIQAAILAILTLSGLIQPWQIIVLALILGLIDGIDVPTRHSLTLDMVDKVDLRAAIALNSILFNFGRIIGPSLAAIALALGGEGVCFAINAASFGAVLLTLRRIRLPNRQPRVSKHPLHEIAEGYRYSLSRPEIRTPLLLVAISSMFGAAYVTLMPAIARDYLHGTASSYGILMGASGTGAVLGAYLLSRFPEHWLDRAPAIAAMLFGLGLLIFSCSRHLWLSVALLIPTATCLMVLGGSANTLVQISAAHEYRGRAISHYTQCFLGMMPWGALVLGALASYIGSTKSVAVGGGIVALSGLVSYRWDASNSRHEAR